MSGLTDRKDTVPLISGQVGSDFYFLTILLRAWFAVILIRPRIRLGTRRATALGSHRSRRSTYQRLFLSPASPPSAVPDKSPFDYRWWAHRRSYRSRHRTAGHCSAAHVATERSSAAWRQPACLLNCAIPQMSTCCKKTATTRPLTVIDGYLLTLTRRHMANHYALLARTDKSTSQSRICSKEMSWSTDLL